MAARMAAAAPSTAARVTSTRSRHAAVQGVHIQRVPLALRSPLATPSVLRRRPLLTGLTGDQRRPGFPRSARGRIAAWAPVLLRDERPNPTRAEPTPNGGCAVPLPHIENLRKERHRSARVLCLNGQHCVSAAILIDDCLIGFFLTYACPFTNTVVVGNHSTSKRGLLPFEPQFAIVR
jgi:hypothetical protein